MRKEYFLIHLVAGIGAIMLCVCGLSIRGSIIELREALIHFSDSNIEIKTSKLLEVEKLVYDEKLKQITTMEQLFFELPEDKRMERKKFLFDLYKDVDIQTISNQKEKEFITYILEGV